MYQDVSNITQVRNFAHSGVFLDDARRSGKQRPWVKSKIKSRILSHSYARIGKKYGDEALVKAATRVYLCADNLEFTTVRNADGERKRKLTAAFFCRDRMCPMCQWRRSLVVFSQLSKSMNHIESHPEKYGQVRCIFLTLTVKNCRPENLSMTLDDMQKGWDRLLKRLRRRQSIAGVYRALEITINSNTGEFHPHYHALILVTPEYFKDEYLRTSDYVEMWRDAMDIDYTPSVWVNAIKNSEPKALAEVAKYTVKPGDWLSENKEETDATVWVLRNALRGRRLISYSGVLKDARRFLRLQDAENADLVNTEEDEVLRGDIVECVERFNWSIGVSGIGYELVQERS